MSNIMREGAEVIAELLNDNASEEVTYTRGASSITVDDTWGEQPLRVTEEYGSRIEYGNVDHLIDAAQIDFGDGPVEPVSGDQIRIPQGNVTNVYEAMAPNGERVWRPADSYGIKLRIHSKQVGVE